MMTWVSVSGTAVSIFLVMIFFMYNSLPTVEVAPESNRMRIYSSGQLYVMDNSGNEQWSMTSGMAYPTAVQLYGDLDGVELVTYTNSWAGTSDIFIKGKAPITVAAKDVDGNFWKMFDFKFISGRPFTEDETLNTSVRPIVLTESSARKAFGTPDAAGKEINVGGINYIVSGVVENPNPIFANSWSDVFLPLSPEKRKYSERDNGKHVAGRLQALLLYAEGTDPQSVKTQVKARYNAFNTTLDPLGAMLMYEDNPESPEETGKMRTWRSSNIRKIAKMEYLIYLFLILLPAINLGSMMRGRLQHRISEIGLRRAYGARRFNIISQLLGENLVVTLVGGFLGLLFSYLFMLFLSSEFFSMVNMWTDSLEVKMATPSFSMLFSWKPFVISIGVCLVLNILTATVPAWRAASIEPAIAISKAK